MSETLTSKQVTVYGVELSWEDINEYTGIKEHEGTVFASIDDIGEMYEWEGGYDEYLSFSYPMECALRNRGYATRRNRGGIVPTEEGVLWAEKMWQQYLKAIEDKT